MNLNELSKPLPIESVEFRVQSINKGGYATILAYKDARVDMNRLDDVVGVGYWKREHITINGSMFCRVSIYNKDISEWVGMEDVGTQAMAESNKDSEKGLASDAFKRACFNWGIGRELYAYPVIQTKLNSNEFELYKDRNGKERVRQTYNLKLKEWIWGAKFEGNNIVQLVAKDNKGAVRFNWAAKKTSKPTDITKPPYPVKNYEKLANSLFTNKCTLEQVKEQYTVSAAAKKTIMGHVEALQNQSK